MSKANKTSAVHAQPETIRHEAISASAGSGKTFQLAHRYIRLMVAGVPPERICALTFSRKAAGEIFDSIVKYLRNACASDGAAAEIGRRIGRDSLRREDVLPVFRRFLQGLHRLHIGTLDSFIISVVRAFPAELGVAAGFEVMDDGGAAAQDLRAEVLGRIFNPRHVDARARHAFLEAYKLATFGREEKSFGENLTRFIDEHRAYYRVMPEEAGWGQAEAIWRRRTEWLAAPPDMETLTQCMRDALAQAPPPEAALARWDAFLDAASRFHGGAPWIREISYLFEKLIAVVDDLRRGVATLPIERKKIDMTAEQCRAAFELLRGIVGAEFQTALHRTRGLHQVLQQHEARYDEWMRRRGLISFSDAQYLLTGANTWSRGALISRNATADDRLYIDYRLDCRLDHWLLDEFQDTSDLQWAVLRNLADEIIQDDSGARSFFYVGDVKQAIYGWRGGNARLFNALLKEYPKSFDRRPLVVSFRSCQSIIDTVNRAFGNLDGLELPAQAQADWHEIWRAHECDATVVPAEGYACLVEPVPAGDDEKPTDEDRYRIVGAIVREIDPLARGLSAAVLVRTNDAGRAVVDALRHACPHMPVVHEGNAAITDSPVVNALLALIRFAAHPGDMFAWRHVQMSPLSACLHKQDLHGGSLSLRVLGEIETLGYAETLRQWGARLAAEAPLDAFGARRLGELVDAAGEFDGAGARDCDAFLRHIKAYAIHESASRAAIRVMTVHQAKGLGFDVVILPDLLGRSMSGAAAVDLVISREPGSNVPRWALKMPRRAVAEADPVLAAELQTADENACFDALCVLYVALTRAKRALYMVTSPAGPSAKALTPAAFLKQQLAGDAAGTSRTIAGEKLQCLYETGVRDWHENIARTAPVAEEGEVRIPADFAGRKSLRTPLLRIEPSGEEESFGTAARLFAPERRDALDYGSALHELLQRMGWIEETDADAIVDAWSRETALPAPMRRNLTAEFRRVAADADVRAALSRPDPAAVLWREKRFEIVLNGRLVSGIFDRVTFVPAAEKRAARATILDYKSDRVSSAADIKTASAKYRPQLTLYAEALARMLNLRVGDVRLELLFTAVGKVERLAAARARQTGDGNSGVQSEVSS